MEKREHRATCLLCGAAINSRSRRAKYCSVECANNRFRAVRQLCKKCGNLPSRGRNKYCSRTCYHAHVRSPRQGNGVLANCLHCSLKFKNQTRRKYCSVKCQQAFRHNARVSQLENGAYATTNFAGFVRNYLIQKLGEKCARCGWCERHPKTGRVPIEVEHIDGNADNNLPENLTLLCPNCHSLTSTFRALNRGRGRAMRLGGRENPMSARAKSRTVPRTGVRILQGWEALAKQLPLL